MPEVLGQATCHTHSELLDARSFDDTVHPGVCYEIYVDVACYGNLSTFRVPSVLLRWQLTAGKNKQAEVHRAHVVQSCIHTYQHYTLNITCTDFHL